MKRIYLVIAPSLLILLLAGGCAAGVSQEQYDEVYSDLAQAEQELATLGNEYINLNTTHESTITAYESMKEELNRIKAQLSDVNKQVAELEASYQSLMQGIKQSTLRNPTWEELKQFIEEDDTDTLEYIPDKFDCVGFAITLRDRAWRRGFRSGFVEVGFEKEKTAHTLTAFQTTDRGLVYVDDTQADSIAYLELGKDYGSISLDAVKDEYIHCYTTPDEFWKPLKREHYTGNLFSYGYYVNYRERIKFYSESIDAYNKAVEEYNQGSTKYSYSQMDSWYNNLEELQKDLGVIREPMGVAKSVEIYWN